MAQKWIKLGYVIPITGPVKTHWTLTVPLDMLEISVLRQQRRKGDKNTLSSL